jgi:hypothetical protein
VNFGAENRNKLIISLVLMGLAVVLVARVLFSSGGSTPTRAVPGPAAAPVAATRPATRARAGAKKINSAPRSLDPSLRYDWLMASEDTKYEGNGRNIFKAQAEIPQPVADVKTENEKTKDNAPPQPPPPPPINLKFFGFASKPGEAKKIFLSQGEDVFIASEGEIVDRRYKVVRISPMSVEIEDVLNNNRQSIPLTQG